MSAGAADLLHARRQKGYVAVGEVTPAALACDGSHYWHQSWVHSAAYTCTPPLRDGEMDGLMAAVAETNNDDTTAGSIEVIASHHQAYNNKQKALGAKSFTAIPKGVVGAEERLMLLWNKGVAAGKLSRQQFVGLVSATPAKLMNIYPQKGRLEVGSDADIVIWDPNQKRTLAREDHISKCDFNIFEGIEIEGGPEYVLCRGRLVKDQDIFRPMQGFGLYRELEPFNPELYDRMRLRAERQQQRKVVVREEVDMPLVNGNSNGHSGGGDGDDDDDIPPSSPQPVDEEPAAVDQRRSSFELNAHPQTPDFDDTRSTVSRCSVRVRAPPGGVSAGFW